MALTANAALALVLIVQTAFGLVYAVGNLLGLAHEHHLRGVPLGAAQLSTFGWPGVLLQMLQMIYLFAACLVGVFHALQFRAMQPRLDTMSSRTVRPAPLAVAAAVPACAFP